VTEFSVGLTDVLLVLDNRDTDPNMVAERPPVSAFVSLGRGLAVGRLAGRLAKRVWDACEPHGEWPEPRADSRQRALGYEQRAQLYAFVRHPAPGPEYHWDPDGLIWRTVALSRLVRPNAADVTYAARVVKSAEKTEIVPLAEDSATRYAAYIFEPSKRQHWLDASDAALLSYLGYHYRTADPLPERLSQALYWIEWAARTSAPNLRWPFIGFAAESLLKTRQWRITEQVRTRLPRLAGELAVVNLTEDVADRFYRARSALVHGNRQEVIANPPDPAAMHLVEDAVRRAVRRAICDAGFRSSLDSAFAVERRWG
jgi:hypothetical protein